MDTDTAVDRPAGATELSQIRHELRTPLSAVLGYTEFLLEDAAEHGPDAFLGELRQIHRAGRLLLNSVKEIVSPSAFAVGAHWGELAARTQEPLDTIRSVSASLLARARSEAPEMVVDLDNVRSASAALERCIRRLAGEIPDLEPLPSVPSAPEVRAPAVRPGPAVQGSVLVVDDTASNRDLLGRLLAKEGYWVSFASGGREALDKLAGFESFDLVLLDIMMPDLDGYEVLRRLDQDGLLKRVPVIMISALDELQSVVRCIQLGAEDYLQKPFDPVLLKARVGTSIEKKRLRDKAAGYHRDVARLTHAAGAVDGGRIDTAKLAPVLDRDDELGELGRVFRQMAQNVHQRQSELERRLRELRNDPASRDHRAR